MSEQDATNLGADDDLSAGTGVDEADLTSGQDLGATEEGLDEGEEELEDYEFEGKTLSVPKSVKEALEQAHLRNGDYTRKTQELAEQRRAHETETAAFKERVQAQGEMTRESAQLMMLDEEIAQFDRIDWRAALAADEKNGTRKVEQARIELEEMKRARTALADSLKSKSDKLAEDQQRETAKLIETRDATLAKEIPNWAERRPKIEAFAKANGVSDDELKFTTDPRIFKLLDLAMEGQASRQQRRAAAKAEEVPAAPVKVVSGSSAPKDPNRMSTAEWMKHREKQLAASRR